jgi:D-alanyl-D-alanine carboxypeptidase
MSEFKSKLMFKLTSKLRFLPALFAIVAAFPLFLVSARADAIDDYLRRQMQKNHIPGLSLAVVREGKIVKIKGYGMANLEWEQPATPDTAFQIASSTKPFTGTALMLLVEDGKLSLEDKISKYLPDAPAAWQNITIRQLAVHSSGITNNVPANRNANIEEFVKAAYPLPLEYEPGSKSAYGLTDFIVLTHIIEKVSGQTLPNFLGNRIFKPLGMSGTQFEFGSENGQIRAANVIKKRAMVYRWENNSQRIYWYLYPERTYSAGGLFSTAADIAKFAVAFDEGKLLSNKNLEQMWSRDKLANGSLNGFGVGWIVDTYGGRKTVGHTGGPALGDILRFPEEKLTVIVLSNGHRVYPYLARGVADFYLPPPPPPKEVKGIADDDAELTAIVKKVLSDGAQDKLDAALFTTEAQKDFVPGYRNFGLPFFLSLEPPESLVLLEHRKTESGIVRRYRSIHGKKVVNWEFRFSKDKKLVSFESKAE